MTLREEEIGNPNSRKTNHNSLMTPLILTSPLRTQWLQASIGEIWISLPLKHQRRFILLGIPILVKKLTCSSLRREPSTNSSILHRETVEIIKPQPMTIINKRRTKRNSINWRMKEILNMTTKILRQLTKKLNNKLFSIKYQIKTGTNYCPRKFWIIRIST